MITERKTCRVCDGKLEEVLDLGIIHLSTFDNSNGKGQAPLVLAKCAECDLVQLKHTVDLDLMYRKYWYKSSLNNNMIESLRDVVKSIESRVDLKDGEIVVDIGANDCTLFTQYKNRNLTFVGYDPAYNITNEGRKNSTVFINDYFTSKMYPLKKKAKVITSIAMLYDLENPVKFIKEIKEILDDEGIWVIQFTDLVSMLKINAFDNICHEHLEYYSLKYLYDFLYKNGLLIVDAEHNNVNGGSLRVYVKLIKNMTCISYYSHPNTIDMIKSEQEYLHSFDNSYKEFANRVDAIRGILYNFIHLKNFEGKKVFVLGASTKGNTLLQTFRIDSKLIQYAAEVNPDKFGLKTVGTNIPIISENEALKMNPDYLLILPWHFTDYFIDKLNPYLVAGGKLIVPLPIPAVIEIKSGLVRWTYL